MKCLATVWLLTAIPLWSAHAAPPNIVYIVADDQSWQDFGFMGNPRVHTPHLDALAGKSARFVSGYVPSSVCRPSLATLLTGLYPHQHGIHFNHGPPGNAAYNRIASPAEYVRIRQREFALIRDVTTLPAILHREFGYRCLQTGKFWEGHWRNGGFTEGMTEFVTPPPDQTFGGVRVLPGGQRVAHGNGDVGLQIGRRTMSPIYQFIDSCESESTPWMVWYAPYLPHMPHDSPERYYDQARSRPNVSEHELPYFAAIAQFDDTVGNLIEYVEGKGLADSTLFVFVSDNGWRPNSQPSPGSDEVYGPAKTSKRSPFDAGLRSPILIRWDGVVEPETHADPVSSIDLMPTILAAAGRSSPSSSHLPGINLLPVARGDAKLDPDRAVFGAIYPGDASTLSCPEHDVAYRWVRQGTLKLIVPESRSPRLGPWGNYLKSVALFHVAEDPTERHDLIADATYADDIRRLRSLLDEWWDPSEYPDPVRNPQSELMLRIAGGSRGVGQLDYVNLPSIPTEHTIISDVRDHAGTRVHQHAYLQYFAGRYWAMWSDGPGEPRSNVSAAEHRNVVPGHDLAGTRVSFATSNDGMSWSLPADLSGPAMTPGFGWIARGFWVRDNQLLALASHFRAPGYPGKGLSLEAFRWDEAAESWVQHGTVHDDTLNNFPPQLLPSGEYMMTRRNHQRQVSVLVGGDTAFNQWDEYPLAAYGAEGRPEEPYWYLLPGEKHLVGLIRDNGRSGRLLRSFSTDFGRHWSRPTRTNFPDATSKFFVHRTSRGDFVMVSNSNPKRRDPLTLAVGQDGLVFTHLFKLVGGRHVDYPHIIEHDGFLLIAFSGAKQTMEVLRVSLDDLDGLLHRTTAGR